MRGRWASTNLGAALVAAVILASCGHGGPRAAAHRTQQTNAATSTTRPATVTTTTTTATTTPITAAVANGAAVRGGQLACDSVSLSIAYENGRSSLQLQPARPIGEPTCTIASGVKYAAEDFFGALGPRQDAALFAPNANGGVIWALDGVGLALCQGPEGVSAEILEAFKASGRNLCPTR